VTETSAQVVLRAPITCLGLDIDDTITADPVAFAKLASAVLEAGGRVVIITSRSEQARTETRRELDRHGIRFNALHFPPSMDTGVKDCPHNVLSWFDRYLWHKVKIAQECGVTHFVDDDQRVIDLFRRYAPEIEAIAITSSESLQEHV
jgi:hypothetical protein